MAPPAGTALWHFRRTQEAWRKAFDTLLTWAQFCISEQINRVSVSLRSPELSSRDYPASSWRALTAWATPVLSTVCGGEDRKLTAVVRGGEEEMTHAAAVTRPKSQRLTFTCVHFLLICGELRLVFRQLLLNLHIFITFRFLLVLKQEEQRSEIADLHMWAALSTAGAQRERTCLT